MSHHNNQTTFKKGQIAWNKQEKIEQKCEICKMGFFITKFWLGKRKCCSRLCAANLKSQKSVTQQMVDLKQAGKSAKEIASLVNRKLSSVYYSLNARGNRFRSGEMCNSTKRKKFLENKSCIVCGWERCLEAAHYIPAYKGGLYEEKNLIPLCPNHHTLFDKQKLLKEELGLIEIYVSYNQPSSK